MSGMLIQPSELGPSADSIRIFGAQHEYPRVDLSTPASDRPFVVDMPPEPTDAEREASRKREREMLDELGEEERRELFDLQDDQQIPEFYSRNKNQCPEDGECYLAHRVDKGDGRYRRGRKHFAWCPQQKALDAKKKLKH